MHPWFHIHLFTHLYSCHSPTLQSCIWVYLLSLPLSPMTEDQTTHTQWTQRGWISQNSASSNLTQDNRSLNKHIHEFLQLANAVNYEDETLICFFRARIKEPLRLLLPANGPWGMLCQFLDLALQLSVFHVLTVSAVEVGLSHANPVSAGPPPGPDLRHTVT